MVESLAAGFGCGQGDRQLLLRLVLTNEFGEPLRAQLQVNCVVVIEVATKDPALVEHVLRIDDIQYGSERFQRDLVCTDNLG